MTPFPVSFPAAEVADCVEHVVHGTGDIDHIKHCAWESAGYFLGQSSAPPAPATAKKGAAAQPSDADMLAFAQQCRGAGTPAAGAAVGFAVPAWLLPLLLKLLEGYLKP